MNIAKSKGDNGCAGFTLGILFGPIGIIIVLLMSKNKSTESTEERTPRSKDSHSSAGYCASCGASLQSDAKFCPSCGKKIE